MTGRLVTTLITSSQPPRRFRLRSANLNRLTVPRCLLSKLARTSVGLFIKHMGRRYWCDYPRIGGFLARCAYLLTILAEKGTDPPCDEQTKGR